MEDYVNRAPLERGSSSDRTASQRRYEDIRPPINPFRSRLRVTTSRCARDRLDIGNGISLAYVAGYQRLTDRYVEAQQTLLVPMELPQLVNAFFGDFRNHGQMHEVDFNYDTRSLKNVLGLPISTRIRR